MEAVRNGQAHLAQGRSPYARRRPEETLLYQVIDDNYPDFVARFEAQGRTLPRFVRREFEDYLKCGRWNMGSCGCAARTAVPRNWWPSAASAAASARAVARGAWWRVLRCWYGVQCLLRYRPRHAGPGAHKSFQVAFGY
jgi:hypothetical protein